MKHTKRTRAENIAGKGSSKHETEPQSRQAAFRGQSILVIETVDKAIGAEKDKENRRLLRRLLYCLRQQMICLIEIAGELPMSSLPPGRGGEKEIAEARAARELECACHEAVDLLILLALPLSGWMGDVPGQGAGVQTLAEDMGRRLLKCFRACDEKKGNGGVR